MIDKNELLQNYRNKINKIICNTDLEVEVRITHRDTNICFNCSQREILYAIQSCLRNNNCLFSNIQENIFGIALLVPIDDITIDTLCLDRFFEYYKYHYKNRITLIEQFLKKNEIIFDYLIKDKKELFKEYYMVKKLDLPNELCENIRSFLTPSFNTFLDVRKKYNMYRTIKQE